MVWISDFWLKSKNPKLVKTFLMIKQRRRVPKPPPSQNRRLSLRRPPQPPLGSCHRLPFMSPVVKGSKPLARFNNHHFFC